MFYKHMTSNRIAIFIVYVDDIIVTRNDDAEIYHLKKKLVAAFEVKKLGPLKYFLGIIFAWSKKGIFINQRKYILDLLKEVGLSLLIKGSISWIYLKKLAYWDVRQLRHIVSKI